MSHSSTLSARHSPPPRSLILEELENFDIPFVCFDHEARPTQISPSGYSALSHSGCSDAVLLELSAVVAGELACPFLANGGGVFPVARELPLRAAPGTVAIRRPAQADASLCAIVVLRLDTRSVNGDVSNRLTTRELQIARFIAAGEANKQVAARLGISQHTVRHHCEKIFEKLGVRNRASLASLLSPL